MALKSIIELDQFASATILPSGYRFKEWTPGNTVILVPNIGSSGPTYYDAALAAIERSDGKYATFELNRIPPQTPEMQRGIIYLSVAELAAAVDKAIEQLAA